MAQLNLKKTNTLQTPTSGSAGVGIKESNELFIVDENGNEIPIGGGLEGSQYVFVTANGTDTENATELQSAYNTAKTMSPSATNRITVICGNGNYNFDTTFDVDTQYIDIVSLDGNRSIIFNGTETIRVTANDVFLKGIDVGTKEFKIQDSLNLLKVENCQGGDESFGGSGTTSGTFTNCVGGDNSFGFGGFGLASGTFTDCVGGVGSFGGGSTASGTFTNCQGDAGSFGGGGTAQGTFTNCVGSNNSFGGDGGNASGEFIDCVGDSNSFGAFGTTSGTFTNCQGGDKSFGGQDQFGGGSGTASGTFTDCVGGVGSFGTYGIASGTFTDCVSGSFSFGYAGIASGTFTNCQGDAGSFGNGGTLEGKLYYCRLTSATFQTVSSGGVTRLCIDGNNDENNQG